MATFVVLDGMRGSGKTTIREMLERRANAVTLKLPTPTIENKYVCLYQHIATLAHFARYHEIADDTIIVLDRGLGSEWMFCHRRDCGPDYKNTVIFLDDALCYEIRRMGHDVIKFVLIIGRDVQKYRRGDTEQDDDEKRWQEWATISGSHVIRTDKEVPDVIYARVMEKVKNGRQQHKPIRAF